MQKIYLAVVNSLEECRTDDKMSNSRVPPALVAKTEGRSLDALRKPEAALAQLCTELARICPLGAAKAVWLVLRPQITRSRDHDAEEAQCCATRGKPRQATCRDDLVNVHDSLS